MVIMLAIFSIGYHGKTVNMEKHSIMSPRNKTKDSKKIVMEV